MRILRLFPLLLLPLFLGLSGCEDVATSSNDTEDASATGMVAFRFSSKQVDSLVKQVDTLEIVLDNGKTKWTRRTRLSTEVEFSDVPAGNWKLVVTLRQGGVAKYEGSTQVTIVSGGVTDAKVVLSAVSGSLRVEIGFDDDDIGTSLPKELVGTWYLRELPGGDTLEDTIPLVLSEDGTASGSDGCNHWTGTWSAPTSSTVKVVFGTSTLKACLDSTGNMLTYGYTKPLSGEVAWRIDRVYGVMGDVRRLVVSSQKTGNVVGSYSTVPPGIGDIPLLPPAWVWDPAALVGVWSLVSMPIEGLDSATGSMLMFDSIGRVSGTIACNTVTGSWVLDGDGKLVIKGFASTFALCDDSVQQLVERGMHLLATMPLDWSIDTISASSNLERITVSSSTTGAKLAVFTLSRFGVTYHTTTATIDTIKVRRLVPDPIIARPAERPVE